MTFKFRNVLIMCLFSLLWGCYPEGAEYVEELDLVYTNYASDFDFKSRTTYALPDSVIKITGDNFTDPDGDHKPTFVASAYSTAIIAAVKDNMQRAGWTQVPKTSNPDVILLLSASSTTNIYYWYDWAYWGWWYPGYYPGWGWYYPGYYPYVSSYRTGSVFIQMVDHKAIAPGQGENVPVVWSAVFNGLAEGSTSSISTRIQTNIGKAYAQSPYLNH